MVERIEVRTMRTQFSGSLKRRSSMTTLTRWEPWREMAALRRGFERLFDEPFESRFLMPWRLEQFEPAVDIAEDENAYIVKASMPGVKPEDVEVTLQNNVLTIKGEAKEDKEIKEPNYHLRERRYGSFMRSLSLPASVKAEKIEAKHEDGVLVVRLPKTEADKPKKIAVKAATANGK
jgi:HSP20 family protein